MGGGPDALNYRNQNVDIASHSSMTTSLPAFGTQFAVTGYAIKADLDAAMTMQINDSNVSNTNSGTGAVSFGYSPTTTLGNNKFELSGASNGGMNLDGFYIASPTHTSSHYQTFEGPLLRELIGGDRNMEQTNLICSADGKTWDELTRDTSYIGQGRLSTSHDSNGSTTHDGKNIHDQWRGQIGSGPHRMGYNKDFAIVYNGQVCLVDGEYMIEAQTIRRTSASIHCAIWINYTRHVISHGGGSDHDTPSVRFNVMLKRGDFIQMRGIWYNSLDYSHYQITRLK